jgi:hypothetical protein
LMLALLFVCVEILPVLMKFLVNIGKPTAYDRVLMMQDSGDADLFEIQHDGQLAAEQARADSILDVEKDRSVRQRDAQLKVNDEVVRQQAEIIKKALAVWGEHAVRRAEEQLAEYERQLNQSAGQTPVPTPVHGTTTSNAWVSGPRAANGTANKFLKGAQLPDINDL